MRCQRCQKTITERTAQLYDGRCVPCHRKRFAQMLPKIPREGASIIGAVLFLPFSLTRDLIWLIRLWLTPLPFKRREVAAILAPVHGRQAARKYFHGLRRGFLHGPCLSGQ